MGVVLAPAIGPSIGGTLVEFFGWRSIFVVVVPFCLASPWLGYRYVPVTASDNMAANRKGASLDWGALLMGGAIGVSLCGIVLEWRLRATPVAGAPGPKAES